MDDLSVILTRLSVEYGTLPTLSEDVAGRLRTYIAFYHYEPDLYLETVIFFFRIKHRGLKNFTCQEFLNPAYRYKYHKFIEMIHKSEPNIIIPYIKRSAVKIRKIMVENNFINFLDYMMFNINIYPIFIDHKKSGKLNMFILTSMDPCDIIVHRIAEDIREMFLSDYMTMKDGMRNRVIMNQELEDAIKRSLKYINGELTC